MISSKKHFESFCPLHLGNLTAIFESDRTEMQKIKVANQTG